MYKIFQNNIFTNPIGWGKSAVGKAWSYRLLQGCTVFFGVILFLIFKIFSSDFDFLALPSWLIYINVVALIFFPFVLVPLCYLRALRAMYLQFPEQIETLLVNKDAKPKECKSEE